MITLRNFVNSDIGQLQKDKYAGMPSETLQALIDTWNQKKFEENYFEMVAIVENHTLIGEASLYGRSEHMVSCGIELYPAYRGKGYGTLAYPKLLSLAKQKGFTIAVAQVRADNFASIALHKKVGFETEDYTYKNRKGNPIYYFIKRLD